MRRPCLDTCTVREAVHGDVDALDFELAVRHRELCNLSLADGTFLELAEDLAGNDGNNQFLPLWASRVELISRAIDRVRPVISYGWRLSAETGVLREHTATPPENRHHLRAAWDWMAGVRQPSDLDRTICFDDGRGGSATSQLDRAAVQRLRAEARDRWISCVQQSRDALVRDAQPVQLSTFANTAIANFLGWEQLTPEARDILWPAMQFLALRIAEAARSEGGYNPAGRTRRGDVIDWQLLRYLPLPAVVVTRESGFVETARQHGGDLCRRLLLPVEFNQRLRDLTLHELVT